MSKLHKIGGCTNPQRVADVVFVHGLDGDAFGSWKAGGNDANYWPRWLANDLPQVGVWSLDYDVHSLNWRGHSMPLVDRATNVLDVLDTEGLGDRSLVFIVHSMGGLLVKQLLRKAGESNLPDYARFPEQTKGIFFIATPHNGSEVATWASTLGRYLAPLRVSVAVNDLKAHAPALRDLSEWFQDNYSRLGLQVEVLYEAKDTRGVRVVNETSANPGVQNIHRIPVDEDHVTIAKPASKDAQVYQRALRFIRGRLPLAPVTPQSAQDELKGTSETEPSPVTVEVRKVTLPSMPALNDWGNTVVTLTQEFSWDEERVARMFVEAVAERLSTIEWQKDEVMLFRFVVLELVQNAFRYGTHPGINEKISLKLAISLSHIKVTVSDPGAGFDLVQEVQYQTKDMNQPENLHALALISKSVYKLSQWNYSGRCFVSADLISIYPKRHTTHFLLVEAEATPEAVIIKVGGELDSYHSPKLREKAVAFIDTMSDEDNCKNVVIDLSHVYYLDSTGSGTLIGALRRATEKSIRLCLVADKSSPIGKVLNITGLVKVFNIFPTIKEAVAWMNKI